MDYSSPFASRGRITPEQLGAELAELAECGYLVAQKDGWGVRANGDRKQRYPYG